jgi:hypothetical protein
MARIARQWKKTVEEGRIPQWATELRKFQEEYARAVEWVEEEERSTTRDAKASAGAASSPEPIEPPPAEDISAALVWVQRRAMDPEITAQHFLNKIALGKRLSGELKQAVLKDTTDTLEELSPKYIAQNLEKQGCCPPYLVGKSHN